MIRVLFFSVPAFRPSFACANKLGLTPPTISRQGPYEITMRRVNHNAVCESQCGSPVVVPSERLQAGALAHVPDPDRLVF